MNNLHVVAISDLHGKLPNNIPICDVLIIAGDICPVYDHSHWFQKQWLIGEFNDWLKNQPAKHIVGVAGNHDLIFEDQLKGTYIPKLAWEYLCDSYIIIDNKKFYGHPWTSRFCDWAFNMNDLDLAVKDNNIPDDTNVLITHGPPYGILDTVEGVKILNNGKIEREYLGSKSLKNRVNQLNNLDLHVFGHIHSSYGSIKPFINKHTIFVNASIINEAYKKVYNYQEFII